MIPAQHLPTACNDSSLSERWVSIGRHSGLRGYWEFPWHLHKHTLTHTFGPNSQSLWSSYSVPGPMKCVCVIHSTELAALLHRTVTGWTQILPALKDRDYWPKHLKALLCCKRLNEFHKLKYLKLKRGKRTYWEPGAYQLYNFSITNFLYLSPQS